MSKILCHYCKREVRDQDELITASKTFRLKPFHYQCFQEQEKETTSQRALWIPVNGVSGNVIFLLMLALATWMLFTDAFHYLGDLIGFIALYPVILRVLSYFIYEIRLPKLDPNKKPLR